MGSKRRKPRPNDLADRYRAGEFAADKVDDVEEGADQAKRQIFSNRSKHAEANKIAKTAGEREERAALLAAAAEEAGDAPLEQLPLGEVTQVYSMFSQVESADGTVYLCVVRKTLIRTSETHLIVGDVVRVRGIGRLDSAGRTEAVIDAIEPRRTVLTRTDSFKGVNQQPIVANAEQMLIVAAVTEPPVKWGLVDRMIVAARSGGLVPIVCLNKVDLADDSSAAEPIETADDETIDPLAALDYYLSIGVQTVRTSVETAVGLDELKGLLAGRVTVLAGHSGVGKSSLIMAIEPGLDIRIGAISGYTGKGRHTTTSARRYVLKVAGGTVVDTPGVKMFGLWGVTADRLAEFFPDVEADTAPPWRRQSYERILGTMR
jgi:ribosome biogenesis GTPase